MTLLLKEAVGPGKSMQCLLGVEITPSPMQARMEGLQSNNATACLPVKPRIDALIMSLNAVVLPRIKLHLHQPLRFWFQLDESTVLPHHFYKKLRFPVLTSSKPPSDTGALLVPEIYRFMALLTDEMLDRFVALHPHTRGFVLGLQDVFAGVQAMQHKSWADKANKAVFRGTCMSTLAADVLQPTQPLRGKLCQVRHMHAAHSISAHVVQVAQDTSRTWRVPLDVGMTMKLHSDPASADRCATEHDMAAGGLACKLCSPCLAVWVC